MPIARGIVIRAAAANGVMIDHVSPDRRSISNSYNAIYRVPRNQYNLQHGWTKILGRHELSWGGDLGSARVFLSAGYRRRSELRITDRDFALRSYEENPQGGFTGGGNPGNFDFDAGANGIAFTADEGCEALGAYRTPPAGGDLCLANYLGFTNLIEPEDRYQAFADVELPLGAADLRVTGLYGRTETVLHTSPSFLPTIAPSASAAFGGSGLFVIPQYAPALIDYCARFGAASGCAVDGSGAPQAPVLAYPVRFRPLLLGGNPLFDNERGSGWARAFPPERELDLDAAYDGKKRPVRWRPCPVADPPGVLDRRNRATAALVFDRKILGPKLHGDPNTFIAFLNQERRRDSLQSAGCDQRLYRRR